MAAGKYERTRKGGEKETVYVAVYAAPDGSRRVEKVRVVRSDASKREHEDAEAAARSYASAQRRAIENKEWTDPRAPKKRKLLHDLIDDFLKEYRSRSGKIAYYEGKALIWKRTLPNIPAKDVTAAHVEAMRKTRENEVRRLVAAVSRKKADKGKTRERTKKIGPSTVRKDMISLGTLFRWAKARGIVDHNPADPDRVKRPSEPTNRNEYLTPKEEKQLLAASPEWLGRIVRFAVGSGMDRSEILALSTRDVDLAAGVIHATRSKTNVARQIPINKPLRKVLNEALKVRQIRPEQPEPVFLKEGRPIDPEALKSAMRYAYKAAKIGKRQPWKILRHTFGSRLAMERASPQEVGALMGHRSPVTTAKYMHLSPEHLRGAMERLEAAPKPHKGLHKGKSVAVSGTPGRI